MLLKFWGVYCLSAENISISSAAFKITHKIEQRQQISKILNLFLDQMIRKSEGTKRS